MEPNKILSSENKNRETIVPVLGFEISALPSVKERCSDAYHNLKES
jgi:hypothetical protein